MSAPVTVIDLASNWQGAPEFADGLITMETVAGRCRQGWTVSLSAAADDDLFFQVAPGDPDLASWRIWTLTITAPSGEVAQLRTWAGTRGERPRIGRVLRDMHLSGPLAHIFDASASPARRDDGWRALRVLFAALRSPQAALLPAEPLDPEGPLAWSAAGFSARARKEWKTWLDWADVAADYRLAGFTAPDAERWSGVYGEVPADLALAFERAGWDWTDLHALTRHLGRNASAGTVAAWLTVPAPAGTVVAAALAGIGTEEARQMALRGDLTGERVAVLRALQAA